MNLQTRKLNLISYLSQLQDDNFIEKIKKFILRKQQTENFDFKPFTVAELITRVKKSKID